MKTKIPATAVVVCAVALALLSGCTRHVSRDISSEGVPGEVIFPALESAVLKEGTFPNPEDLRLVASGVTKDQLYQLLGPPHFREGYYGVREWDYLFHFRKDGGVVTCQYKVIFDKDYLARSFYWKPEGCADLLETQPADPSVAARYTLSTDALFAFGRSGVGDIQPGGREEIAHISRELQRVENLRRVRVTGHTDIIGDEQSNLRLSQRRAETVRQLLIDDGVPADLIWAAGRGESEPVKQCDETMARTALIACLQPNRRVEIVASLAE